MPKPLTIGVDTRELKVAKTGIKTYLEELCREFEKMNSDEIRFHFIDTSLPVYTGKVSVLKWIGHLRYQFWKQVVLPLKAWGKGCDILFCADNCVPYIHLGYKAVPSMHDAFCFESPEDYGKLWLWSYRNTTIPGARRSTLIIAATAYGKKQVAKYTGVPEDRFIVVHDGPKRVNYNAAKIPSGETLQKFRIERQKYILHVGSMYKRKNLSVLVAAFAELKKQGYDELKLVLAGVPVPNKVDKGPEMLMELINKSGLQKDVIITGYLKDAEIGNLYENALLYVFPSLNEGFGLPVLESFEHMVPVIVSNNTCLPEVGGDAVLSFDPYNHAELLEKIKMVLDDEVLRKDLIAKGTERLKDFTWQKTAKEIIEVFKKAAKY